MTRRRPRAAPRAAGRAAPGSPARTGRVALGLAVLAGVVALSWFALRGRPAPPRDPIADMPAGAAFQMGARLASEGRHVESSAYFRRAADAAPSWESRFNLASSLRNAALEVRVRAGREQPVMRSSAERVRAVGEATRESARAMELARDAHSRALTLYSEAQNQWTWGFAGDALELARAARALDPAWGPPARLEAQAAREIAAGGSPR